MSAEPVSAPADATSVPAGGILLHADRVSRRFGGLLAVRDVDLVIPDGAIISIIGPNGAGKTTSFNVIAGIIDPSSGTVSFRERTLITKPRRVWLESFLWVLPSALVVLLGVLLGAANSDTGIGFTGLIGIGLLVFMLVLAIARPPWYQDGIARIGVIRSARPNDV